MLKRFRTTEEEQLWSAEQQSRSSLQKKWQVARAYLQKPVTIQAPAEDGDQ